MIQYRPLARNANIKNARNLLTTFKVNSKEFSEPIPRAEMKEVYRWVEMNF